MIEFIGKLLAAIIIAAIALIAIAVLLAIGLGAMLGVSIAYCLWLPALYFVAIAKSLNTRLDNIDVLEDCWLGRNLRIVKHIDQERSYPHYFFGPVEVDMRFTTTRAWGHRWVDRGGGGNDNPYLCCGNLYRDSCPYRHYLAASG